MRRLKKMGITVIILTILVGSMAGCVGTDYKRTPLDVSNSEPYSESQSAEALAIEKDGITLAENSSTDYKIIYESYENEQYLMAVRFLQKTLTQIIGCDEIEMIADNGVSSGKYISIGNTTLAGSSDVSAVENDGYILRVEGDALIIKGADWEGTKNGIYDFLESELECMYLRNDYDYIPNFPTIKLPKYDEVINPSMAWRRQYQYETVQNDWYERLRLNGTQANAGAAGWGTWCHSQFSFVPPDEYFESNPEYYALIDGERQYIMDDSGIVTRETHLCLTNDNVYDIVKKGMRERILNNPEAVYWDFSIMDTPSEVCGCEECKEVNEKYQSNSSTIMMFINKLAKELGDEFPHVMLSTLAYQDCINPPVGLEIEDNIVIKLCAMPGSQGYSYQSGANKNSKKLKDLVVSWGKVVDNIVIWDYVVNFNHLLLPFPNYDVQKENIDFYVENNVIGIFHQGSREKGDEMADMRSYLLSRQMWDKDIDLENVMKKYIQLNYGAGAEYIEEYLDTMSASYINKNKELNLYDDPKLHKNDYLSAKNISKYMELTDSAMDAVKNDPMALEQVEKVRMSVLYAKVMESSFDISGKKEAVAELKIYTDKFGVEKHHEVISIDEFYNETVPSIINGNITAIVFIVIACVGSVAAIPIGVILFKKFKKKKAVAESEKL